MIIQYSLYKKRFPLKVSLVNENKMQEAADLFKFIKTTLVETSFFFAKSLEFTLHSRLC